MERSVVEVYRDEIGEPARRDDARVEPEDLRARPGAEAEDGRRVDRRAVEETNALEQRRHAHLLEDRQAVVGAAAVGAEPHPDARPHELGNTRDPVAEEHVGARAVRERRAPAAHQLDLPVVEPDAVDADHPRAQHAEAVEMAQRGGAVLAERALALVASLGHVDVKPRGLRLRDLPPCPDHRRGRAVRAVRRGLHHRGLVVAVRRDQLTGPARRVRDRLPVALGRALPVVHAARQDQADPDHPRGLDHRLGVRVARVLEVEEVHAGRDAALQHLGEGEGGAERDPLTVQPLGKGVEHAIAPAGEVEVVAETAQERLEGVAVRVDRPRHQRPAGKPDVVRGGAVKGLDRHDPAAVERHRSARSPSRLGQDQIRDESHVVIPGRSIRWRRAAATASG